MARLLLPLLLAFAVVACGDDDVEDTTPPIDELDTPEGAVDGGVDDVEPSDLGSREGACGWLSPDDISDATGLAVETATPAADGCTWELTESAAVIDGPNEGEDAELQITTIDERAFEAAQDDAAADEQVDDLGDEAFVAIAEDESDTRIFVHAGSLFFTVNLAGALDGQSANSAALVDLSAVVIERAA